MKKFVLAPAFLLPFFAAAQNVISFSDQSTLLPTSNFHSGNSIGVVDMNGDKKDDIVRASNNATMYIEYQNAPNATFSENSFANSIGDPWGMCVGDLNNDGYNDVFWGDYGNTWVLVRNSATTYTGTNIAATLYPGFIFVQGCNFADINNDHFLDLFVCNDDYSPHIYVNNNGTGWTFNQGLMPLATFPSSDGSGNYASIWTDINNDGLTDCMVTHCRQGVTSSSDARRIDQVFLNNGNGTYTQDITNWTGLRDGAQGWSTAWGDIDNDGDMDAFVLNYDVNSTLMINDGNGVFTNVMSGSGINNTTTIFGENATFQDFDNDGYLDLMISGDHHLVYHNNGNHTFTLQATDPFPYAGHTITAHAVGDLNGDGWLDVYASYCDIYQSANSSRNDKLWMNNTNNGNHYVMFDLVGGAINGFSNKNGVGASVKIYGPWGVQVREVRSGEAYGIQNSMCCHFGLGSNTTVDSVVVRWPSGIVDVMTNLPCDQHYTINEGMSPTATAYLSEKPVSLAVYPNPVSDVASIRVQNFAQYGLNNLSLNIYDVNGKLVYSEAELQQSIIMIGRDVLSSGLYFVELKNKDKRLASERMMVE
ncbi:MAG TPA: FG-GAP-like repeat-containing protein [Bacteroidia bacterium]|nr:FG-GAP-like repeat-containing protein [Bacteroidia bacterium]